MTSIALPPPDRGVLARRDDIIAGLVAALGETNVITDEYGRGVYAVDASAMVAGLPLAVALPDTTRAVSRLLRFCYEQGVRVVPRGAGTSLTGGALATEDSVVVCLSRLNRVLEVDVINRLVRAEAGATNQAINKALSATPFHYAPDPASRLSCSIGGNIATDASGPRGLKHGSTSSHVVALEVVLIDGEIVSLGGGELEEPGYALLDLFVGAEGRMGIITQATLRIVPRAEAARPLLFSFDAMAQAVACAAAIDASTVRPSALELIDRAALHLCRSFAEAGYPRDAEAVLLVEIEGSAEEIAAAFVHLNDIAMPFGPMAVIEPANSRQREQIWQAHSDAVGSLGQAADFACIDGSVPSARLSDAVWRFGEICANHRLRGASMAHAADGCVQFLVLFDGNDDGQAEIAGLVMTETMNLCLELQGTLSGAHGIGLQKRDMLPRQLSSSDLEIQAQLKTAMDAEWLLNAGKVLALAPAPDQLP